MPPCPRPLATQSTPVRFTGAIYRARGNPAVFAAGRVHRGGGGGSSRNSTTWGSQTQGRQVAWVSGPGTICVFMRGEMRLGEH